MDKKFEITAREKFLLQVVAAMIAEEPCLHYIELMASSTEEATQDVTKKLHKIIKKLTKVIPS